jgi:hypothetical protein
MIFYNETPNGPALRAYIASQGHCLWIQDGVWVSDDDAVVQAIINTYIPSPTFTLESTAQKYIDFGRTLSLTLTAKLWAINRAAELQRQTQTPEQLLALLDETDKVNRVLKVGALEQAAAEITAFAAVFPQFSDAATYALTEISRFANENPQ